MVTVLGEAGVGKSRLLAALEDSLEADEWLLRGRCLANGRGITFWPLREHVGRRPPSRTTTLPTSRCESLDSSPAEAATAVERVASAIGAPAPVPVYDVFWGAHAAGGDRRPAAARPRPRDVHWGETTFIESVEYLAQEAEGPLLVVCLAGRLPRDERGLG